MEKKKKMNTDMLTAEEFGLRAGMGAIVLDARPADEFTDLGFQSGAIYAAKAFIQNGIKGMVEQDASILVLANTEEAAKKTIKLLEDNDFMGVSGYILTEEWQRIPELMLDFIISVDAEEMMIEMKHGEPHIIDIRPKLQYDKGHLEGAEHITFRTLLDGATEIPRTSTYYVYDENGERALSLLSCLRREGHFEFYHVKGGYESCMQMELTSTLPQAKPGEEKLN